MLVPIDGQLGGIQCANFAYIVDDYESALESLHQLVNTGWLLLDITLIDDDRRMTLPVELFDGQSFQTAFQALQAQWQQVLYGSAQARPTVNQQWLIEQHRHLLAYYEELIALLTRFSLQRTEALAKANERPLRNAERIQHYERLISQQQRMLASTQASYQRAAERLHQWTVSERGQ